METEIVTPALLEQVLVYLGYLLAMSAGIFATIQTLKPVILDALRTRLSDNAYEATLFALRFILGLLFVTVGEGLTPVYAEAPFLLDLPAWIVAGGSALLLGVEASFLHAIKRVIELYVGVPQEPEAPAIG